MGVDVHEPDEVDRQTWDRIVERSPHGTPFHYFDVLEVVADHAGATFHPLLGYVGQEPVGLFPWFEVTKGPMSTFFSPPPDLKVTYLGPALVNQEKLKRRKAESRHREFVEECLTYAERVASPSYVHVRTARGYDDVRPFVWNDFEAVPGYTYLAELAVGEDDLFSSFSSDARRNIRNVRDSGRCHVEEGGVEAVEAIIAQVKRRHVEQGTPFKVTTDFGTDLYERSPDGTVRPYVMTVDDEFSGGMLALELGDTLYRWQGGTKPDVDLPINDYLDWTIMQDAIGRGVDWYDLIGAQKPRLCEYKSKFATRLDSHLSVERGTTQMKIASKIYKRIR